MRLKVECSRLSSRLLSPFGSLFDSILYVNQQYILNLFLRDLHGNLYDRGRHIAFFQCSHFDRGMPQRLQRNHRDAVDASEFAIRTPVILLISPES